MQTVAMEKAMLNDQWISEAETPDPKVLPHIPGYHILVRPVSVKKQTKGGILLPDSTVNDISILTTVGKVLAIGDTAYEDDKKFPKAALGVLLEIMSVMENIQARSFFIRE